MRATERDVGKPKLVVGVGASAGGLEACKRFLAAVPADSGLAVVVVMHLDPFHQSRIAEIFRASTALDVVEVSAPAPLQADRAYVIVPDTSLELRGGVLYPDKPNDPHGRQHPIDALFSSLAADQATAAVCAVLSGSGDDGSAGLQDVKALGGLCLAQSPETAEYEQMPRSAIDTGAVDEVLPPEEMPRAILDYAERRWRLAADTDGGPAAATFDLILDLLGRTYRVNFRSSYKRATLQRRTERRMALRQLTDPKAYLAILQSDPREVAALYDDLLIGVTQFFRDGELWERLLADVLPGLLSRPAGEAPLKLWVSGCATGEEAYTLAIVVVEALERLGRSTKVQIFATDVAESALAFARRGVYPAAIRETVSPERLARFFRQEGERFEVVRSVRDLLTFAVHNLLGDPPFSKIDLVTCRNVLIYLEEHAQQRVLDLFHFALKPGGLLLLGSSETIGQKRGLFEAVSTQPRVYRSTATAERVPYYPSRWHPEGLKAGRTGLSASVPQGPKASRVVEQIVLSRYTWACVAVSESLEIQSFWGPTDQYLTQPTGEARMDLLAWAKPGIYPRLRAALEQARDGKERVTVADMRVERSGVTHRVECTIEPITPLPGEARLLLVSFRDVPAPQPLEARETPEAGEPLARQLETENRELRAELQGTVEQLEGSNEEYRASHEELLSLNEELQSNNEEIQASKEELQSLNEEMATVNRQLEDSNAALLMSNADLENLLTSTNIPILFLDRELRIRRFVPAATQLLRLLPSDLGRPIEHLKDRFQEAGLISDARTVLEKLVPISSELQVADHRWYTRTIRPYRTEDDRIDGVCIAYFDITAQKRAAEEHADARRSAEALVAESPAALLVLDPEMRVVTATAAFGRLFKVAREEVEGLRLFDLGSGEWDVPSLRELLEKILPERALVRDYQITQEFRNVGRRHIRLQARRLSRGDLPPYILLSIEDLTDLAAAEEKLKIRAEELYRENERRNEFLAMLGHELRNPLAGLSHGLDLLELAGDDTARIEELRRMMARQAGRIAGMLDQLLDVARVTTGKIKLASARVDLAEAARAAVEAVAPQAEHHKHELSVSLPPEKAAMVQGDSARLTQAMENLLSNAVKYTDDGGKIRLGIETDVDWIRVRVADTGVGLDAELLPHVFDLFAQGSRTLARSEGGLGLGLSLVKRVIELHGGTVEAASPGLGQGSVFTVCLPRVYERRLKDRSAGGGGGEWRSARPLRVLVVDDDADLRTAMADLLVFAGHEAVAVSDGPSALETARTFNPQAALIDLGLPKMDGYEVARKLRQAQAGDRIFMIAVTGYQRDAERLQQAGFDRHLLKPPDLDLLFGWLDDRGREQKGA